MSNRQRVLVAASCPTLPKMTAPPWVISDEPVIMGILNLTPDSFSDGGELDSIDAILRRADQMRSQGAALLDLGAVSTRPGADEVTEANELKRLAPALEALVKRGFGGLSVDTYRPEVAAFALDCGASMINDVRGGREPGMYALLGERKPWTCLMHMRGRPKTMQVGDLRSADLIGDVSAWLTESVQHAVMAGLPLEHILVDPGIGFGKTDPQNLALTQACGRLSQATSCPVLYGASRKSLIGRIAGIDAPQQRLAGSLSLAGAAYRAGARVFRVHDVGQTKQFLDLERALGS